MHFQVTKKVALDLAESVLAALKAEKLGALSSATLKRDAKILRGDRKVVKQLHRHQG